MPLNPIFEPGAKWMRCDLHVHSPFDGTKDFGENIDHAIRAKKNGNPERLGAIAKKFVSACNEAVDGEGLDLVALTDHNSIDGYRHLKPHFDALCPDTLRASEPERELRMPMILPGVEFSVGAERPIHFLVIFASDTPVTDIEKVIQCVFGNREPFNPQSGTPQATGESISTFIDRLYGYCQPDTGERDLKFVLLPAHFESKSGLAKETGISDTKDIGSIINETKGHLRQWAVIRRDWHGFETAKPFEELPLVFRDLLLQWHAVRCGSKWEDLTKDQKRHYANQEHWPLVKGSDADTYEKIGKRFTWLKMETPDVEGIRLALLDPGSRLRRTESGGPPNFSYTYIKRIAVRGTDFFEDIEIPLSSCLTTLIGGRGSGKSTLIEYLRYALDRNRIDDLPDKFDDIQKNVQSILSMKDHRDHGNTKGTLLPDHQILVDLKVGERTYQICRTSDGITITQDADQGNPKSVPLDVRALLSPRILSQRQIAQIAHDPASQRHELDAIIETDTLRTIRERQETLKNTLGTLQETRKQLSESRSTASEVTTELQKIRDYISSIERDGRREVFVYFHNMKQKNLWLDDNFGEIKDMANRLMDLAEEMEDPRIEANERPAPMPENVWIDSVTDQIQKARESTDAVLREQNRALLAMHDRLRSERERNWQGDYNQAKQEYDMLMEEMEAKGLEFANHEKLLQRRTQLERKSNSLQKIDQQLKKVESQIENIQAELESAYKERFEVRRRQTQELEKIDADVRLEILAFMDRSDFESNRELWFGGAGLQERDWNLLCDYVFEIEGDVPDRLRKLVSALRADIHTSAYLGKAINSSDSEVVSLLGQNNLTGNFFNALRRKNRIRLDEMERFLPEDLVRAQVRANNGSFKTIETGSVGEKSTAILSLLLSAGDQPIIVDQPEDDLDNQYIYQVVVDLLRHRKFDRQIIISTHNANIPVNGDAELIVALDANDRMGQLLDAGSIDKQQIKNLVTILMEGSAEAFRLRSERYGY